MMLRRHLLVLLVVLLCPFPMAYAQDLPAAAADTPEAADGDDNSQSSRSSSDGPADVSRLLNELRRQRQEVLTDLQSRREQAGAGADPSRPHRQLEQTRRAHADRDEELKSREKRVSRQMSRLEELIREQARSAAAAPDPMTPVADPPAEEPLANQPPDDDAAKPDSVGHDENDPRPLDPVSDKASDRAGTPSLSATQIDAISVTDQPVDRLALANNLYGTGEYALALKVYAKIDLGSLVESEQTWIRYQIANCQRQLKNSTEAQRGFRIVTSIASDSWWGHTSRWWLDTSDRLERMQGRNEKLQQSLEQLRKESDEQPSSP